MSVKLMLMVAVVTSHCCVTACTCYSRCPLLSSVAEAMFVCQQVDPPDLVVVEVLEFIHRPPVTSLTPFLHVSSTNTKYRRTPSSIYEHINWHTEFVVSLLWATVYVYSRTDHISDMDRASFFFLEHQTYKLEDMWWLCAQQIKPGYTLEFFPTTYH